MPIHIGRNNGPEQGWVHGVGGESYYVTMTTTNTTVSTGNTVYYYPADWPPGYSPFWGIPEMLRTAVQQVPSYNVELADEEDQPDVPPEEDDIPF